MFFLSGIYLVVVSNMGSSNCPCSDAAPLKSCRLSRKISGQWFGSRKPRNLKGMPSFQGILCVICFLTLLLPYCREFCQMWLLANLFCVHKEKKKKEMKGATEAGPQRTNYLPPSIIWCHLSIPLKMGLASLVWTLYKTSAPLIATGWGGGHITSLPCRTKCCSEVMCSRICCHNSASRAGSDRNFIATSWNLTIQEFDG